MASKQTPNYALNQWEPSDQVVRLDFNADNEKIDTALAGLAQSVSTKAEQSELDTLSNTMRSKADQSALNSLTTTVNSKANQSTVNSLTNTVNTKASQSDLNTLRQDMVAGDLWVKIAEHTLSAANATFNVSLANINFSDYWKVKILFDSGPCSDITVHLNNVTTKSYMNYPIYSGSYSSQAQMVTLPGSSQSGAAGEFTSQVIRSGSPPVFWGENYAVGGGTVMDLISTMQTISWETLTSMQFKATSGTIPSGAKVLILGMPR